MKRFALNITSFFIIAYFMIGCVAMKNLTIDDLKKPENLRREKIYNLKIPKIQKAIFEYSEKCGLIEKIVIDPENSEYGKIAISTMGLTQLNVGTLIEFHEKEEQTEVKVWSFHEHWTKIQADKILGAIENPKICR
jgi:hypothetical protein